jgi:hypothetical protein
MSKMTDSEINIAAAKYAGFRVLAVLLILALNGIFVFKLGWDMRNWQWLIMVPAITFFIGAGLAAIENKSNG